MHPDRVFQFVNLSLRNLQMDYIDLYLIHWPVGVHFVCEEELMPRDPITGDLFLDMKSCLEDVWRAMESLVDKGLLKAIGISNCTSQQIQRICNIARIPPACLQVFT